MNGQMNNQYGQSVVNNMQNQVSQQAFNNMQGLTQQPVMVQPKQSKSIKEIITELEEKNVIKIVGIVVGALIILGVFLPMITVKFGTLRESSNLWDSTTIERFIVMILGVGTILAFVFNKFKYLTNISAGAAFMISLSTFDAWIELSSASRDYTHLSLAFFVYLLCAMVLIVLNIADNIDDVMELFKAKPKTIVPAVNVNSMAQPMPQTNFNQVPVSQPVQPAVQTAVQTEVICTNCGAKKIGQEPFCTNCGKQF